MGEQIMAITGIVVTQPTFTVVISSAVSSTVQSLGTEISFLGSAMTGGTGGSGPGGTGNGATGRQYVHSSAIDANAKVYIGTDMGSLRLFKAKWSRSTTSVANDTITINVPIFDTDQLGIDT